MPVKPRELTGPRLRVEALGVAALALLDAACRRRPRRSGVRPTSCTVAAPVTCHPVRANERDHRDDAGVGEQRGDLADAAHVLVAVLGAEAEVVVQPVSQVVAVEQVRGTARRDQASLDLDRDRRLARPGQPGEPHHQAVSRRSPRHVHRGRPRRRARRRSRVSASTTTSAVAHEDSPRIMPAPTVRVRRLVDQDERTGRRGCGGTRRRTAAAVVRRLTRPISLSSSAVADSSRCSVLTSRR